MATLELHLPDRLKDLAETLAADAGFDSVDAYIANLIQSDEPVDISPELEAELIRGLDSGPASDAARESWEDLKRQVRARRGGSL